MEVYSTEEEQIDAIKRWWKENGNTTLIALTVVLVLVFGWRIWQDHTEASAESASAAFQNLLDATQKLSTNEAEITPESIEAKSVETFGQTVLEEHGGTAYALHTHLLLAKKAVVIGDYETAERQLKDILRAKPEAALNLITRYRLAKVLLAQDKHDEAIKTLEVTDSGMFAAAYEELRGDIVLNQGDNEKARAYYKSALDLEEKGESNSDGSRKPILEMKYYDLSGITVEG